MSTYQPEDSRKVTTHRLREMKERGEKIAMLTAYDYTMATLVDSAGMDVILVGDSASNIMAGNTTTLPITLDQMIYHGKSVMKAVKRALVVVDLGLTPQSINKFGSYNVRAREEAEAKKLIADAHLLEELGCFAIVLEKIPATLAERVANELSIPIIGIGAGGNVDGQVLVLHDMLGLNEGFRPRFLRLYAEMGQAVRSSVGQYSTDVKTRDFPNSEEQY